MLLLTLAWAQGFVPVQLHVVVMFFTCRYVLEQFANVG